jgi:high-affinity Fe2+/Pb2+ permease
LVKPAVGTSNFLSLTLAVAMVSAFLLAAAGLKLALERQTRARGLLMIAAALVLVMNVMIWTV